MVKTYTFDVILSVAEISDAQCDALYDAGCDDGTVVTREGTTHIAFDREAESLEAAVRSAVADVRAAGLEVARVEMDALV